MAVHPLDRFIFLCAHVPPLLHPFPTRRSSDLDPPRDIQRLRAFVRRRDAARPATPDADLQRALYWQELPPLKRRGATRSEEHTSELQSPCNLVCRLLLEKKNPSLLCTHDAHPR